MTSHFSAADYAAALRKLLPRGLAWSDDPDDPFTLTNIGLSGVYEDTDTAAVGLLADAMPITPVDLLPEWESSLGLPDPCMGAAATLAQRQAAVLARFTAQGDLSEEGYIAFAAALGFTITFTKYRPFQAGLGTAGSPIYSDDWAFVLGVNISADANDLDQNVLMCELNAIKPADVILILTGPFDANSRLSTQAGDNLVTQGGDHLIL